MVGGLVLLAVLVGVLNALVGGGEWTFGWNAYRYDDSGYTVGDGTVYAQELAELDIDWIDGKVEIVICQDAYASVSERVTGDVSESSRMRFRVSEDGRTLSVKYLAPSTFFGGVENKKKDLIVRIPEKMLPQMEALRLKVVSSEVAVEAIPFSRISVEGVSGSVALGIDARTEEISVVTVGGSVTLFATGEPSFTLAYTTVGGGTPLLDFPHERVDGSYVCGDGTTAITVETVGGELNVKKKN